MVAIERAGGPEAVRPSPLRRLGRLARRTRPAARLGAAVLLLVLLAVVAGPWLAPQDPFEQDLLAINEPVSSAHWLGTDSYGRDTLSRLVLGTRISLGVGLAATLVAVAVGVVLSLIAVTLGGWLDAAVFGFVDLVRAMPGVLFALAMIVALGPGVGSVVIALGIAFTPHFARISRASYQREVAMDYVAAARGIGAPRLWVLRRHIVPNIAGAIVTQIAIILPRAIVTESLLSFLGLGVTPETPTWGRMIADATQFVEDSATAVLAPVAALSVVTFALSMIGDELRLRLDPMRSRLGR